MEMPFEIIIKNYQAPRFKKPLADVKVKVGDEF